jgi:hypothetical protein
VEERGHDRQQPPLLVEVAAAEVGDDNVFEVRHLRRVGHSSRSMGKRKRVRVGVLASTSFVARAHLLLAVATRKLRCQRCFALRLCQLLSRRGF